MRNPDPTTLPAPLPQALIHSSRLVDHVRAEMAKQTQGCIPFSQFMNLLLYAPGLGYYSAGTKKFGADGDFVTAPEISALFSRCLARQCQSTLIALGVGDILELGAGSGIMAADMLAELAALNSLPRHYFILEISAELRQRQQQTLQQQVPDLAQRVIWLDTLPSDFNGIIVGNEVLDAMPIERFRITAQGVKRLAVSWRDDRFVECEMTASDDLLAAVEAIQQQLGQRLPEGYTSEYNAQLAPWFQSLADSLKRGVVVLIDYGYPRREYYHPQRTNGTLLCHYRQRAHDDPYFLPGLQDITASVDFSAVAIAGMAAELQLAGYTSQSYFLFSCGLENLLAEIDPQDQRRFLALSQQVKQLTLPGEMGERFKAIAFSHGIDDLGLLQGFSFFDQRQRL